MNLFDVNVLLLAHREEMTDHERAKGAVEAAARSGAAYAVSELVLSAVVRIATHPGIFDPPTPLGRILEVVRAHRDTPNAVIIAPGSRHWSIFTRLCQDANAEGNLVPDAYLAALAIESGSTLITLDRGFARFEGLRWRDPLRGSV